MVRAENEPPQGRITPEQAGAMARKEWHDLRGKDPVAWVMVAAEEKVRGVLRGIRGIRERVRKKDA